MLYNARIDPAAVLAARTTRQYHVSAKIRRLTNVITQRILTCNRQSADAAASAVVQIVRDSILFNIFAYMVSCGMVAP